MALGVAWGLCMKRLLPGRVELGVLIVLSLLCAAVVAACHHVDLALALVSVPLFITAAVMGMRRSGQWDSRSQELAE